MFLNVLISKKPYVFKSGIDNKVISISAVFVLLVLVYLYANIEIYDSAYKYWIAQMPIVICLSGVLQMMLLALFGIKDNLLLMSFWFLAYLFYFSHTILLGSGFDISMQADYFAINIYGTDVYISSVQSAYSIMNYIYLGFVISNVDLIDFSCKVNHTIKKYNLFYYGVMIVLIVLPIHIYNSISFMGNVLQHGYAIVTDDMDTNTYSFIRMDVVGFLLMIIYASSREKAKLIMRFGVFIYFILMFSGSRAYHLMQLVALVCVYYIRYYNKKELKKIFSKKNIFLGGILSVVLLQVVMFISFARGYGLQLDIDLFFSLLKSGDFNPFVAALVEFGFTENTFAYVYLHMSEPAYGSQLIASFFSMVPGLPALIYTISDVRFLTTESLNMWNYGGSFIEDYIFDFGTEIYCIGILGGYVLQKILRKYSNGILTLNVIAVLCTPIIIELLFTVRSTLYKIPRLFFLYTCWEMLFFVCFLTILKLTSFLKNKL